MPVSNGDHDSLYGSEPGREGPAVVLDEYSEKALHATQQGAVHHVRAVGPTVLADVLHVEAYRHVEVELDGGELPLASECVVDFEVDLGAVEGSTTLVYFVRDFVSLHCFLKRLGRSIPICWFAYVLFGTGGQVSLEVAQTESPQDKQRELKCIPDLVLHLVRAAEDVRVVLGKAPHTGEAMQDPTALVTIDRSVLSVAQ